MWQKGENATPYNWYIASGTYDVVKNPSSQNVCGSLTLGGQSGWRLPTKKELITLVDYSIPFTGPTINTTYFPNAHADNYWLSTTYKSITTYVFFVDFYYGIFDMGHWSIDNTKYVRCVRGGQSSPSLKDNGNGTVTDNGTGLMWQQAEEGYSYWDEAMTYCEGLSLAGQSDWRLPNVRELESLTDDTKYRPAINTFYFPNANSSPYWSSTTIAYYTSKAWYVDFYDGTVGMGQNSINRSRKSFDSYNVRCVRGGSSPNNCAASVSSSLVVHIPILTYSGSNYWADLQYNSNNGQLTVAGASSVSDASPYSNCTASTLSSDFKLHVPVVMLSGVSYWLDLQWNGSAFVVAGGGAN